MNKEATLRPTRRGGLVWALPALWLAISVLPSGEGAASARLLLCSGVILLLSAGLHGLTDVRVPERGVLLLAMILCYAAAAPHVLSIPFRIGDRIEILPAGWVLVAGAVISVTALGRAPGVFVNHRPVLALAFMGLCLCIMAAGTAAILARFYVLESAGLIYGLLVKMAELSLLLTAAVWSIPYLGRGARRLALLGGLSMLAAVFSWAATQLGFRISDFGL